MEENLRIIISGGGTGGHIFPAVSIANAIKEQHPEAEILFVGAEGRMEMQRVPAAGYPIKGLPVAGFDRKNLLKNVSVLFKLVKSQLLARKIIKDFKPHAAVGVGGYASRSYFENGRDDGYSDTDTRAKLLCRSNQQTIGKESLQNMRGIRRHGTFL